MRFCRWSSLSCSARRLVLLACASLGSLGGCRANESEPASTQLVDVQPVVDAGCPQLRGESCNHAALPEEQPSPASATTSYGQPLGEGAPAQRVELSQVLREPGPFHGKRVELAGVVERACSRKGCWMELAPERGAPGCRVTFKDYGFLIPTTSAGKRARLEGTVQVTRVEAPAVAHYESEGAQFPEKQADGGADEVRIIATGVQLSDS